VIITVTRVDKRKMILWQSLRVEVNRDTHGQGSASDATLINTSQCPGRWMISRWVPRRMWQPPMIGCPIPVGLVFGAAGRPSRQVSPPPRLSRQVSG
jgi:hypothetical protein